MLFIPDNRTYSTKSDVCKHNELGQLIEVTNALNHAETFTYNKDGLMDKKIRFDGKKLLMNIMMMIRSKGNILMIVKLDMTMIVISSS